MHEELNQFARNEVWILVPRTSKMNVIGNKWVFKNKLDEHGVIVRNKARLVANQEEGIIMFLAIQSYCTRLFSISDSSSKGFIADTTSTTV